MSVTIHNIFTQGMSMRCYKSGWLLCLALALSGWWGVSHGAMSCTGQVLTTGGNYVLPHANLTVPNIPGYTLLYTATHATMGVGVVDADCDASREFRFTLTDIPATGPTTIADGYTIYPTSISGIGISINLDEYSTSTVSAWPDSVLAVTREASESGKVDAIATIRVWKTPDYVPVAGSLKFVGPKLVEYITSGNNGASGTISTCPTGSPRFNGDTRTCLLLSRVISGDVTMRSGTCDLADVNQVVNMGEHPGLSNAASAWKSASFRLKCLNAYGYGGGMENATERYNVGGVNAVTIKNTFKNNTIKLMISPRTPPIDPVNGILDITGGATGYGIQLVWGDVATQVEASLRPVELDTYRYIDTISSDFSSGPYYFGTSPIKAGKDGSVQMSARYVRTTGSVTPGPANATVEVIATYE